MTCNGVVGFSGIQLLGPQETESVNKFVEIPALIQTHNNGFLRLQLNYKPVLNNTCKE
jgi:hypothetical protein